MKTAHAPQAPCPHAILVPTSRTKIHPNNQLSSPITRNWAWCDSTSAQLRFRTYVFPVENTLETILGRFSLHVPAEQNYYYVLHCLPLSLIRTMNFKNDVQYGLPLTKFPFTSTKKGGIFLSWELTYMQPKTSSYFNILIKTSHGCFYRNCAHHFFLHWLSFFFKRQLGKGYGKIICNFPLLSEVFKGSCLFIKNFLIMHE